MTLESGTRLGPYEIVNWSHSAYANRHIVHRNDCKILRASLAAADCR